MFEILIFYPANNDEWKQMIFPLRLLHGTKHVTLLKGTKGKKINTARFNYNILVMWLPAKLPIFIKNSYGRLKIHLRK